MSRDYEQLFNQIVVPHLHSLKELVATSERRKVLVHEWVLEVERSWAEFADTGMGSDFVARLAFFISGLRERARSNPSEDEIKKVLIDAFDASIYCYFEFGARKDVAEATLTFCRDVDEWMNKAVLVPHYERFEKSREIVPFIDEQVNRLENYGLDGNLIKTQLQKAIKREIEDASSLVAELKRLLEQIPDLHLKAIQTNPSKASKIDEEIEEFVVRAEKFGYHIKLDKELVKKRKRISEFTHILKILKESLRKSGIADFIDISKFEIVNHFNLDKEPIIVATQTAGVLNDEFLRLVHENRDIGKRAVTLGKKLQKEWSDIIPELFPEKQMKQLVEIESRIAKFSDIAEVLEKSLRKSGIADSIDVSKFEILNRFDLRKEPMTVATHTAGVLNDQFLHLVKENRDFGKRAVSLAKKLQKEWSDIIPELFPEKQMEQLIEIEKEAKWPTWVPTFIRKLIEKMKR
jgi:hypothetical protein